MNDIEKLKPILQNGILIKITKEQKFAEDVRNGLFLHTASWFREQDTEDGRGDPNEYNEKYSIYCLFQIDMEDMEIKQNNNYLSLILNSDISNDFIRCINELGNHIAVIYDVNDYINTIISTYYRLRTARKHSWSKGLNKISLGNVEYDNETLLKDFYKDIKYMYQHEFRIIFDIDIKKALKAFNNQGNSVTLPFFNSYEKIDILTIDTNKITNTIELPISKKVLELL